MNTQKFYSEIAKNVSWLMVVADTFRLTAELRLQKLESFLPSGSGFDNGSTINLKESRPDRLVIDTAFHHMDEHGYYDGWTEHKVIVTPSLQWGYVLRVTGRNRNWIKDYIYEVFDCIKYEEVE
jgi:hypothetical protein